MAISKPVQFTPHGISQQITIDDAYYRIDSVSGSKSKIRAVYSVRESAGSNSALWESSFEFTPNLNSSDNFIKQAYEYLKSLPEFANATDC